MLCMLALNDVCGSKDIIANSYIIICLPAKV